VRNIFDEGSPTIGEAMLLARAGVSVPAKVDLELSKYTNNRGARKLMFKPEQEIKDPFGAQQ